MKNLMLLLGIVLLISCDPESTTSYKISNKTNTKVKVLFLSSIDYSDTIEVAEQETVSWKVDDSHYGSASATIDMEILYDSIVVKVDDEISKIFKSESSGKNIYNFGYWNKNKKKKRSYEYTYEITEDDIESWN